MEAYLFDCCAAGKLLQVTAGADRKALITTPTPLPQPLQCWRPAATKPGSNARQSYTLADSSPLFPYPLPSSADATNSSRLVPIALSPARPPACPPSRCNRNLVTRQLPLDPLGQFRKSSSVVRLPHLKYRCSPSVSPWPTVSTWHMTRFHAEFSCLVVSIFLRAPRNKCSVFLFLPRDVTECWLDKSRP